MRATARALLIWGLGLVLACHGASSTSSDAADAGASATMLDPTAAEEAPALAGLSLPRAAVAVGAFGTSFFVALEGHDGVFVDATDPTHPTLEGTLATDAAIVAVAYDEARHALFVVDTNAAVYAVRAPSAVGA